MKCNVGKNDRMFRIILGVVILAVHYIYYLTSGNYIVWGNIGWIPLLTGLFKWCPSYLPFKINTDKKK